MKIQLTESELKQYIREAIEEAQDENRFTDFTKGFFGGKTAKETNDKVVNTSQNLSNKTKEIGNNVKQTAKNVGNTIANGAKNVGNTIATGAKKAGQAVASGAQAVGQGAKKAGQAVASGAQAVGQGVQNAVNDGRNAVLAGKLQNQWNTFQQTLNGIYQNSDGPQGKFTQSSIKQINKLVNDLITKLQNSEAGYGYGYSEEE